MLSEEIREVEAGVCFRNTLSTEGNRICNVVFFADCFFGLREESYGEIPRCSIGSLTRDSY